MTEQELYERVVSVREGVDTLVTDALDKPPTVELCVFAGTLGAVVAILVALEGAGVPVHEEDEEPHPSES